MTVQTATISEAGAAPTLSGKGRIRIRLIDAGQGSSGFYPPATLRSAAEQRVFPAGTHVHLDHPSRATQDEPRSTKDLIGVLAEDAVYDPDQQALDADAEIYSAYRQAVTDMKDDVGMSIRAAAEYVDGPTGRVITRLVEGLSVDVVTKAGRGGKILEILEHARPVIEASSEDVRSRLQHALTERFPPDSDGYRTVWLRDFDEANRLVWYEHGPGMWQDTWTDNGTSAALTGAPIEVRAVTQYIPLPTEGETIETNTIPQEAPMPHIEESRLAELEAAEAKVGQLEAELATANDTNTALTAENAALMREKTIAEALSKVDRPGPVLDRIGARLAEAEGDLTDEAVQAAVAAEDKYLADAATVTSEGRLSGFGPSTPSQTRQRSTNAWGTPYKEQ